MSTIDDLPIQNFSDLSQEEAFELLRQIRLSRRTSKKKTYKPKSAAKTKPLTPAEMTADQAAQLLKLLGGA